MRVNILFFASYRDIAGSPAVSADLGAGATVADCAAWLTNVYPTFAEVLARGRVAVNLEIVDLSHPLADGDEVAFMPPMSGG